MSRSCTNLPIQDVRSLLIGRSGSSAFRLSTTPVSMSWRLVVRARDLADSDQVAITWRGGCRWGCSLGCGGIGMLSAAEASPRLPPIPLPDRGLTILRWSGLYGS
jgi:hypothetical protein